MPTFDVSVIIPVRDGVAYIKESIESVLNQSVLPREIIVVDDGSTDSTKDVVRQEYGDMVRLLDGPQLGAGPARNIGVAEATSRYIAFVDADDIWNREKLEKQMSLMRSGVLVGAYASYFVENNNRKRFFGTSVRTSSDTEAQELLKSGAALPCLLSSWLLEREVFLAAKGFDPLYRFAQDFDLALRLSNSGLKFLVVRENLVEYRIHESSKTFTNYLEQKMFAEYAKFSRISDGTLSIEEWQRKFWGVKQKRQAKAGFFFRRGLSQLGSRIPIRAIGYLFFSLIIDPMSFAAKLRRQSSFQFLMKTQES